MKSRKDFLETLTKLCDNENGFYDGTKAKSYNPYLLFSIGGRDIGKTFWYKTSFVYDFLTKGEQFMYIRRRQTDLDEIDKESFITEKSFKMMFYEYELIKRSTTKLGTTFEFKGDGKDYKIEFSSRNMLINQDVCCYMKSLSTWGKLKGSEYDRVEKILYDEVLIDVSMKNAYYLPNEVDALIQLIKSVERDRNIDIILLSNATNYDNIYFNHFGFYGDNSKRFWYLKNKVDKNARGVLIEFPPNKKISAETDPDFYSLSMGTKVFESNVNNTFQQRLGNGNIQKLSGKKIRLYSIYNNGLFMTVYSCDGLFYVAKGYDKNLRSFSFDLNDVENGHIYLNRNDNICQHIRRNFHRGLIVYEDMSTKVNFNEAVKGIL